MSIYKSLHTPLPDLAKSFQKVKLVIEAAKRAGGSDEISRGIYRANAKNLPVSQTITWLKQEAAKDDFKVRSVIGSELMNLLNEL